MNLAAPLEAAGYSAFLQLKREKGASLTIVRRGKRTSECLVEKTPRRHQLRHGLMKFDRAILSEILAKSQPYPGLVFLEAATSSQNPQRPGLHDNPGSAVIEHTI